MTEPTELLPCPFCGSSNVVHYEVEGRANHHFECCECLAASMCKTTYQEALAAWNTRTPQPTQSAPPAGREPLTPEQINAMARKHPAEDLCGWSYRMGIADAEAMHGIKAKEAGNAD